MERLFLQHPHAVGETYAEHQAAAMEISGSLFCAAAACFIHALVPGLFETTASRAIRGLNRRLDERSRSPTVRSASAADALEYQI